MIGVNNIENALCVHHMVFAVMGTWSANSDTSEMESAVSKTKRLCKKLIILSE